MKTYYLQFGSGNPPNTGLAPTFIGFAINGVTAVASPVIAESAVIPGIYVFTYGPTTSIVFKADGGGTLSASDRYIEGALDPVQAVDEKVGTLSDSFGSTSVDPTSLLGYAKRALEFNEGAAVFTKSTGLWDVYSRGSSTLLMEKSLTNTTTSATKS